MDSHQSFKQWVIDLFKAATTGEAHGGLRVISSADESGQGSIRHGSEAAVKTSLQKTSEIKTDKKPPKPSTK